jgi:hypothetical protein
MTSANSPHPRVAQLLSLGGNDASWNAWTDYRAIGLTEGDIPALVALMTDRRLNVSPDPNEHWAPMHAWRALAQFSAVEAIQPLIDLRIELDDDWLGHEFPHVMAAIGPRALAPVTATLRRDDLDPFVRGAMADAIAEIGQAHLEIATPAADTLAEQLEHFARQAAILNSLIIGGLIDLSAVQHADLIRRAMEEGPIDLRHQGDWEDVQIELGLLTERITPPPQLSSFWFPDSEPPPEKLQGSAARARAKRKAKRKISKKSRRRNRH